MQWVRDTKQGLGERANHVTFFLYHHDYFYTITFDHVASLTNTLEKE